MGIETDPVTGGPAPYDPDPYVEPMVGPVQRRRRWVVAFEYEYEPDEVTVVAVAAARAFALISDPKSMAPIATVTRPDGTVVEHDLAGKECYEP